MTLRRIAVEISGVTPLLIHRFSEQAEQAKPSRRQLVQYEEPRVIAERAAYRASDGTYYFSAYAIPAAMGNAGAAHKMRGSRKSLRFVVPSAVTTLPTDAITILKNGSGPARAFEVDSRPVTIPATKGRVMRHRPRFDDWGAAFELLVDDELLPVEMAHQLLTEAGVNIGLGDFRPERRGPFGRFRVTRFEDVTAG